MVARTKILARWLLLLIFVGHAPCAWGEDAKKEPRKLTAEDYELFEIFADTLDQIERNYVKDVNRRELMEAAIQGALGKLDPYSNYIPPDELGRFKGVVENEFGGIGIQIAIERDQLKILTPLVGTPAYRAGLLAGDNILEIDGKSTAGITLDEAVRRLKGPTGTSVALTIMHPGATKKETITVPREMIHVDTVLGDRRQADDTWDMMLDPDRKIGYIRLTAFSRDTARDLKKALEELQSRGIKGLVLDLRFNPGGLLTSAVEVSDLFISKGRIVSTQGRNTPERTWDATVEGTFEGFPMTVLVNRYSASASEIVAACLQDHHRAAVIGERTWGKGSVQNLIELEGGKSALKLTTAAYRRPNGHNIHRFPDAKETDEWGVMPDKGQEVKFSDSEMGDMLRDRRTRDILAAKHPAAPPKEAASNEKPASTPEEKPVANPAKKSSEKPADAAPVKPSDKVPEHATPDQAAPPSDAKPGESKPAETKPADAKSEEATPKVFVDRQLQKALDYLTQELARAG